MSRHTLFLCLLLAFFAGVVAPPAAGGQCAAADDVLYMLQQPQKAQDGELNQEASNTDKPNLFSGPRSGLGTDEGLKPSKSQPVLTTTRSQGPSSHDLLTTLSLVVLVNNLMPRPLPARWALATTGAAWLWLAFKRLQPWLPQTSPPSRATTASTPAAGADAVAAAAWLSAPATAAGAVGGVGGDPSTRWWQHVLLFMELLMGNAVDAILLMGLLLLPVIALRRWWRGKKMWGSMSVEPTTPAGAAATAAAPATEPASDIRSTSLVPNLARSSIDGLSTQLHSAGQTAARLAKAMHKIGSHAVRRNSFDSTSSSSSSSSSGDGITIISSSGSSSDTSSTGSMVSPGQSVLQPATPPLLFAARPAGPLASSGRPAPHNHQLHKTPHQAADDTGSPSQATTAAAEATHSSRPSSSTHHPEPKPGKEAVAAAATSSSADPRSGSSDDVITAAGGVRVKPGDSGDARQMPAAPPCGSRTDSNLPSGVGLNLGALGTIRTASARGPAPPMYPTRALYSSPLETVVISCKLGSNSSTTLQARGTAAYVTSATPTAAGASAAASGPSLPTRVEVPLSPVQASLAAAGHGSSISAQRDLRAVVEAAVRQAVAASNISVLSTSVTSFPGCVHVVATAHLTAAAAATDDESAPVTTADVSTQGSKVAWQEVVQQILAAQGPATAAAGTDSSGADVGGILSREGLCLKHLLVQDAAGNIHYLWVSPEAAAAASDNRSAEEGSLVSVQSGTVSPQPSSPSASSSSSCQDSSNGSIYSRLAADASTMVLSSFTLPNDTAAEDGDAAPAGASKLLLPAEFADALSAANAALRVVLSADPAAPSLQSGSRPVTQASRSGSGSASPTNTASPTQSPSSVVSNPEVHTSSSSSTQHLLIDHTLWPGTSSWPAGGEIDLLQLLPQGTTAPQLAQQVGPVLNLNLVASGRKGNTATAATAMQVGMTAAAAGPTAADAVSMSEPQLSSMSAAAATSSSSTAADAMDSFMGAGVPDTAPVRDHEVTRTPSAAQQLHSEITTLLNCLQANNAAKNAAPSTDLPVEATPALPLSKADVKEPEARPPHQQDLQLGEYLLLQLPLLLIPSAACQELSRLQERMAGDVPADAHASTAGIKHMLPLINDIAAALNMAHSSSRPLLTDAGRGVGLSAETTEISAPPPAAAPAGSSPVPGLQPQSRTAAAPESPQPLSSDAGTSEAGTPRLTGVRALIAQREQMAAAAAASAAASPRVAALSPRASAVSPRALLPGTVPSPRAHASPARSLSWSRSPSPALSTTTSFRPLMAGRPSSPTNHPTATASAQAAPQNTSAPAAESAQTGNAAAAHSTQQPSAEAGLMGESGSSSSTLQPMVAAEPQAQTQDGQQQVQVVLSVEQKQLLKSLLQYMFDQGLEELSAAVSSYVGIHDARQLVSQAPQQVQHTHSSAGTGHTAAGLSEIEPAEDKEGGSRPSTAGPNAAAIEPLQDLAGAVLDDDGAEAAKPPVEDSTGGKSSSTGAEKDSCALPSSSSVPSSAAAPAISTGKDTAKVLQQASAAHEQAMAAHRAAAATESALQLALQQISALSAAAAQASRQAAEAQVAAAAATERAAAVEERAERERALHLISSPAGAAASGTRGIGIWGLLSSSTRAVAATRASGSSLLGGVMSPAEPPVVPEDVTPRDVLLGFEDERLEVQYRRWKALQCRSIDRAAFLMQLFRQVVYVWRIGRLMYVSAGTGLSLVLLCKYEAVVLLPYVMMFLTPDFYVYHRHLLLCLSQIAAALTVGMISATEVYRNEWSSLLQHPGPTLLARPSMMLAWYYLLVPLLQQQTLPEQALSCLAQLGHSLLIYVFILKGTTSLLLVVPLLVAASGVSFGVSYVADALTREQAVAGARRSLLGAVR